MAAPRAARSSKSGKSSTGGGLDKTGLPHSVQNLVPSGSFAPQWIQNIGIFLSTWGTMGSGSRDEDPISPERVEYSEEKPGAAQAYRRGPANPVVSAFGADGHGTVRVCTGKQNVKN